MWVAVGSATNRCEGVLQYMFTTSHSTSGKGVDVVGDANNQIALRRIDNEM